MGEDRGSVVLGALRAGLPLYAGTAVVVAAGFGMRAALVGWAFADAPEEMARFGLVNELLQWTSVVGLFGLGAALLRLYPERVADRRALVASAWIGVAAVSSALTLLLVAVPGLARAVLGGEEAASLFAIHGWKSPAIGVVAVAGAALHAASRFREKAILDATERGLVAVASVVGAVAGGLQGLVWGSLAASLAVALMIRPRGGRFEKAALRDLAAIGAPNVAAAVLETARVFVVLRILAGRGPGEVETGWLATAAGFALPLVLVPEILAQAIYPSMVGPGGEADGAERTRRRLLVELTLTWLPLVALAGAAAWWLLPLPGGGRYAGAAPAFVLLLPGVAAHGFAAHTGYVLLVRGRNVAAAWVGGISLAVAVAAAWALAPRWGAAGGAAAISASLVVRTLLLLALARAGAAHEPRVSLDEVRAASDPASFPRGVLDGAQSAALFFGAAFHGRNDAIHVADAGIRDAVVVDADAPKLGAMRAAYPSTWRFVAGDAYAVAQDLRERGERFDVVVADAWQKDCGRALDALPLWCALARRHVLVTVAKPWLDAQGLRADAASLGAWLASRRIEGEVESVALRAGWSGGTWWLVIRVRSQATAS